MAVCTRLWQGGVLMDPVINIEENIGKTVGRRKLPKNSFAYGMALQTTGNDLRNTFGYAGLFPKGVYRFKTHEEADAWTLKMLISRQKN